MEITTTCSRCCEESCDGRQWKGFYLTGDHEVQEIISCTNGVTKDGDVYYYSLVTDHGSIACINMNPTEESYIG